jgi:hypothetical protein
MMCLRKYTDMEERGDHERAQQKSGDGLQSCVFSASYARYCTVTWLIGIKERNAKRSRFFFLALIDDRDLLQLMRVYIP